MNKFPIRLILPIFIPLGLVAWILSNFFYLDLELKREPDKWTNYIYQLQKTQVSYKGQKIKIPIILDQSFTHWGNVEGEEIILHYIQTKKSGKFTVCRSSPKDFWIYSGFSDDFIRQFGVADTLDKIDILFSVLRNKLSDDLKKFAEYETGEGKTRLLSLAEKEVLSDKEMLFLLQKGILSEKISDYLWLKNGYHKYIPLLEVIELIIPFKMQFPLIMDHFQSREHYHQVYKRIWRFEHFFLKGMSSLMILLGVFGSYLLGWKDLLSFGYRFNSGMKMYHWWHYTTLFLPKNEHKIRKHFKQEYKKFIEKKKEEKLQKFVGNWQKPDSINERKLKNILHYEGKREARIYCLERTNFYQSSSFAGREFLIKHFYEFLGLNRKQQNNVNANLVYLKDISNISLKQLSKERLFEKTEKKKPLSPFDKFLEKLPSKYHSHFFEFESLLKDFAYDQEFIACFGKNQNQTYLNILRKQNHFLLRNLLPDNTKLTEISNSIGGFKENELCSTRSILYELKEKKIKWEKRDRYLDLISNRKFGEVESELMESFTDKIAADSLLDSAKDEEKAGIELDKTVLKEKSFLIVANFITSSKADSLINAFEELGAAAFITTKIPRKNPKDVDIVLLMTGYMKHGMGYYFKKRFSSYLRMSHIDTAIVIDNICEILGKIKLG